MGQISTALDMQAAPDDVWQAISTPATFEQWLTIHTKWKGDVPATFSAGATADEVVTMLGMANTISWKVDEYEAPSRMRISGTGMAGVKVAFAFAVEPAGDGSRASVDAEFSGQMVVGALGKAVERDAQQNLDASLRKLAELVA